MSNETTSVVLSICGITAVVGVLVILAAFLLLRVLKLSIFGIAINAMRILTEPKEEPTALDIRAQSANRTPVSTDLRTKAQSLDFDAAVARQRQATNQSPAPTAFSAQSAAPGQPIQPPSQSSVTYPQQPIAPQPTTPFAAPGITPIQPTTTYTPQGTPVPPAFTPPHAPGQLNPPPSPFPPSTTPTEPGYNAPLRRPRRRRPVDNEPEDDGLLGGMLDGDDIL